MEMRDIHDARAIEARRSEDALNRLALESVLISSFARMLAEQLISTQEMPAEAARSAK